jgi:hypothetical protein
VFRRRSGDLERVYRAYRDRVQFFLVYTRELHAGWQYSRRPAGSPPGDGTRPGPLDDWRRWARAREADLGLDLPLLVDSPDGREARRWDALPTQVFGIGADGRIAYRGSGPAELGTKEGHHYGGLRRWLETEALAGNRRLALSASAGRTGVPCAYFPPSGREQRNVLIQPQPRSRPGAAGPRPSRSAQVVWPARTARRWRS